MRLLIFLGLLILFYYLVKGWVSPSKARRTDRDKGERDLESEMVRDPRCQTYIPKNSAIRAHIAGRDYYFCSRECMKKFERETRVNPDESAGK